MNIFDIGARHGQTQQSTFLKQYAELPTFFDEAGGIYGEQWSAWLIM